LIKNIIFIKFNFLKFLKLVLFKYNLMANCVMKYNKNNIYSGINIYNKLDKDIQEIIDNYLIQMRKEEEQDEGGLIEDLSLYNNFAYRRFMTEFNLHYKFNNSIMKSIVENDMIYNNIQNTEEKYYGSISEVMYEYLIVAYYSFEEEGELVELVEDKLVNSTDYIISKMFRNDIHNMDKFEKLCKQMDRNPIEVINAVITFQNEVMGELDISTDDSLDFAKISCWFINEYVRAEIINSQD